ncbi:MAG: hypothetical protein V1754_02805 [Pseudomonadota bacterium]
MLKLKVLTSVFSLFALGLFVSCGSNGDSPPKDTGPKNDGGSGTCKTTSIVCSGDCQEYVMDAIMMPPPGNADACGFDLDNDGNVDNALGGILGAISGVVPDLKLQGALDTAVNSGKTIILFRMQPNGFANENSSKMQGWVGKSEECCTTKEEIETCKTEARAAGACFGGDYEFEKDPTASDEGVFCGKVSNNAGLWGPAQFTFTMPIVEGSDPLVVKLQQARLRGTFSADGKKMLDGAVGGAITKQDLDTTLIPTVAAMLNKALNDPETSPDAKKQIISLFDEDENGEITVAEVKGNDLIGLFLGGDVDIDGDGIKELSLGVCFTAVDAKIK